MEREVLHEIYNKRISTFGTNYESLKIYQDGGAHYCKGYNPNNYGSIEMMPLTTGLGNEKPFLSCTFYEPGTFSDHLHIDKNTFGDLFFSTNKLYQGSENSVSFGDLNSENLAKMQFSQLDNFIINQQNTSFQLQHFTAFNEMENFASNAHSLYKNSLNTTSQNLSQAFNTIDNANFSLIDLLKASVLYQVGNYQLPTSFFDNSFHIRFGDLSQLKDHNPLNTRLFEVFRPTEFHLKNSQKSYFAWDAHLPIGKQEHSYYHANQGKMASWGVPHNHTSIKGAQKIQAIGLHSLKFGTRLLGGIGLFFDAQKLMESEEKTKTASIIVGQWLSSGLGAKIGGGVGVLLIPVLGTIAVPTLAIGGSIIASQILSKSLQAFADRTTTVQDGNSKSLSSKSLQAFQQNIPQNNNSTNSHQQNITTNNDYLN